MSCNHFHVTGRVQGVYFRAHTQEKAHELGLKGWVRNMSDGSVEIHAEGSEEQLKKLETWCWEGPPASNVTSVNVVTALEEGCEDFAIRRDG